VFPLTNQPFGGILNFAEFTAESVGANGTDHL
jgi:hypothetical protein